jgi:hypothetical protein
MYTYEILLRGELDERRLRPFATFSVEHTSSGNTQISAPSLDQAALHALLSRIRDLGVELLALRAIPLAASAPGCGADR